VRTEEFSELVQRESRSGLDGAEDRSVAAVFVPPPEATTLPRQSLLDEVRCPHCALPMERTRFAQRASVVIDICPAHGVWLDAGELTMLLDHVRQAAAGGQVKDPLEEAESTRWDGVIQRKLAEEQLSAMRLAAAQKPAGPSPAVVLLGTAVGGPWLGLFLAMRGRGKRK
jgi:Zn-finger nucleic acid-binding protein